MTRQSINLSSTVDNSIVTPVKSMKKAKPLYNTKFIISANIKKAKQEQLLKSQRFKFSPVRKGIDHYKSAWERLIENTMDPNKKAENRVAFTKHDRGAVRNPAGCQSQQVSPRL